MKVIAEFTIKGLPKLFNAIGRKHWTEKASEARKWKHNVLFECNRLGVTNLNLTKAKLTFIRQSMRECDFDSLVNSFKSTQDGLVVAKVIIDDKPSVIGQATYLWEYRMRKLGGQITVKIEAE